MPYHDAVSALLSRAEDEGTWIGDSKAIGKEMGRNEMLKEYHCVYWEVVREKEGKKENEDSKEANRDKTE